MCCFTKPVNSVKSTKIFTRVEKAERQYLVYSMMLDAEEDLAMVLPLPVAPGADERSVHFINLKDYPEFFSDLEKGFPPPQSHSWSQTKEKESAASSHILEIVQVGDFEASFVPTVKDFSRLDERFRLPDRVWKKLTAYKEYGFAVFKLRPGSQQIHPMAFSFPRRDSHSLFFPTVHIHDGKVHPTAEFDHILYCQPAEGEPLKYDPNLEWRESSGHPRGFMQMSRVKGLIEPDQHCYRTTMHGRLSNHDIFAAVES